MRVIRVEVQSDERSGMLVLMSKLEILHREGIGVVSVPDDALDGDGFMLESYRHRNPKDKTHGNPDFGRLMMQRVIQYMQHDVAQSRLA